MAAGAAFWLVISASPIALAIVSLYGMVVDPSRVASDLGQLADAAPGSLGSLIGEQLQRVAATDTAGLSIGLAVSIVLAVWSASAVYGAFGAAVFGMLATYVAVWAILLGAVLNVALRADPLPAPPSRPEPGA